MGGGAFMPVRVSIHLFQHCPLRCMRACDLRHVRQCMEFHVKIRNAPGARTAAAPEPAAAWSDIAFEPDMADLEAGGTASHASYARMDRGGEPGTAPPPTSMAGSAMDALSSCAAAVARAVTDCFGGGAASTPGSKPRQADFPALTVGSEPLRVLRLVGEGGFAYVYLGQGTRSGKQYAIKRLRCQTQEQIAQAQWEVSVHRELAPGRPRLLKLHTAAFQPLAPTGQEAFLVLDFHGGGTVDDVLASRRAQAGVTPAGHSPWCYPEQEALALALGVVEGMAAFHHHSPAWAHRDIKPGNILLSDSGAPVLMDFGSTAVARVAVATHQDSLRLQETAAENCSMAYRAPELWDPPTRTTVTEATDIWAFGCTLYALAFGFSPFEVKWVVPRSEASGGAEPPAPPGSSDARVAIGGSVPQVVDVTHLRVLGRVPFPAQHPYSSHFTDLILDCLATDPAARPDADVLMERIRTLIDVGSQGGHAGEAGEFVGDGAVYGSMASKHGAAHEIF